MARRIIVQVYFMLTLWSTGGHAQDDNCTDGIIKYMGDGWCDNSNNNEGCLYDGGDCCICANIEDGSPDSDISSSSLLCVDPSSPCYSLTAVALQLSCTDGIIVFIGDGWCYDYNNNEGCLFDGGDCCECTSIEDGSSVSYTSSPSSYCVDPSSPCYNSAVAAFHSNCTDGALGYIGDGWCDEANNNEGCLFDGGDCCECTCDSTLNYQCGIVGFSCADPEVVEFEPYICEVLQSEFTACPAGLQREWIVENATQARALADAVRCSDGIFDVTWKGNVIVDKPISISDGTALNVKSIDAGSVINGDGQTRLFSVVNASLNLRNITLRNGSAIYGGAIAASRSRLSLNGVAFIGNSAANDGGALHLSNGTTVVFGGETSFFNNTADHYGGALCVMDGSNVSWIGNTLFLKNAAASSGGALYLAERSSAVWTAEAHFLDNTALYGGALFVMDTSSTVWNGNAYYHDNSAKYFAGALYLRVSSSAIWTAESYFLGNSADELGGGAVIVEERSNASWRGETIFFENVSNGSGGGLYVAYESIVEWATSCIFSGNSALDEGGAVYATDRVFLSWGDNTLFIDNTAQNGGAVFGARRVDIRWSGETNFTSNYARLNGGAVGYASTNGEISVITINGTTSFVNNKCGRNGGAMSLVQSLAFFPENNDVLFLRNSAGVSGGAVYVAFTGIGMVFKGVEFVENFAQLGGGVYSTGSGTEVTVDRENKQVVNPMTFTGCNFVYNLAFAAGGAVDSASGQDVFVHTWFEGNKARLGGALRLAGIASIDNCSFEENVSELGGGPAVSNVGYMSNVTNSYFDNNVFECETQTFLDYNEWENPFETVCYGCPSTYFGCSLGEGPGSPTCTSLSEAGVEHATSIGGYTTVEELLIHKGYWRATNTSTNVLRCFNTKACKGGLTGALSYCSPGYEGPYCSVCSKNYVSSLRFTCRECSDRIVGIVIITVLVMVASIVGFVIVSYMVSAEVEGAGRRIVDRVKERVPLQSLKIIITVWQILTQFTTVANVNFPNVYNKFLDGVDFLNFDWSWVLSVACFLEVGFHDQLLWTTIAPLVIMGLLSVTYAIAIHRNLGSPETTLRNIQHEHISMALLVTFLVYSSVSSVVFQMFACDDLDDGKRYLRADYTIECDSPKHRFLQIYSGFMVLLYPVGIPALYAVLLFRNNKALREVENREEYPVVTSISNLWKPYKPTIFYYEVIECARRISLTGVIVFIYPNSAAQVSVAFAIAVVFIFVSEVLAPYESPWDAWISRMGHAIIFASMYLALLLKVDVSGENDYSQKIFEVILVACHGCMILAVVVQVVIIALSLKAGRQQEDPRPRLRRPLNLTLNIESWLEDDDNSKVELSPGPVEDDVSMEES